MNERIRELVKQATLPGYMLGESYVQSRLDEQKFAELIVRECANIVQDSPWQLPQGYKSADQAKLIKKYFGVEE
jgi:hypothetical protein